jgi:hypothetical protein
MREKTEAENLWVVPDVLRVYIGWDPREIEAYEVAKRSLIRRSSRPVSIAPLVLADLELAGLMRRPIRRLPKGKPMIVQDGRVERRVVTSAQSLQMWDEISSAPMATQFANSRFLVPLLARTGWALFVDCDVVFLRDPVELFALADPDKAVMCVQHGKLEESGTKMDGQIQTVYSRKNWSSVMLFNCDHPKNKGLTLDLINKRPGRDLHRFCWLDDQDIGELPPEWNWLVNVQPRPADPKLAHFTLGGPWLPNWLRASHDDVWLGASQDC